MIAVFWATNLPQPWVEETTNVVTTTSTPPPPQGAEESCRDQAAVSPRRLKPTRRLRTKTRPQDCQTRPQSPKWTKLKYVPGLVGSLVDQADAVGLKLEIHGNDKLVFAREGGRTSIPLTGWGAKAWARAIRAHIKAEVIKDLHDAVKPTVDLEGHQMAPRRKDMQDLHWHLDKPATLALRNHATGSVPKRYKQWLDLDFKEDRSAESALDSILAASIRPNARLCKSHSVQQTCRCGGVNEDVEHVLCHCPDHSHIRDTYMPLISEVKSLSTARRPRLSSVSFFTIRPFAMRPGTRM